MLCICNTATQYHPTLVSYRGKTKDVQLNNNKIEAAMQKMSLVAV